MSTAVAGSSVMRGVSRSRRLKDRAFMVLLWVCGVLALLPLIFLTVFIVVRGLAALNIAFFTQEPVPPPSPGGGFGPAFVGTMMIVGLAALFSIPLGVLSAVYLSEYGKGRLADAIRFISEVLLSVPSIIAGAFIWALVVVLLGSFSALAGALALTVIMWPIITRSTEEILKLVPNELREGGLALGLRRWRVILRVVIPTAGAGILTAVMLALARGLGETAPILLTALGNDFYNRNPLKATDAVPLRIYNYAQSAFDTQHVQAWGGALVLLIVVLMLSIGARIIATRHQRRIG
jgi:phosphate transport system permease protein